jgi:hypothetical protein
LNDVQYVDEYEGDFSARRSIVWTLNFTMKLNFYGPVNKTGIIRRVFANTFSDINLTANMQRYTAALTPEDANILAGNVTITENFTDF